MQEFLYYIFEFESILLYTNQSFIFDLGWKHGYQYITSKEKKSIYKPQQNCTVLDEVLLAEICTPGNIQRIICILCVT